MAEHDFNFDAEFSLLDIGATSSLLQTGSLRPSALAYHEDGSMEAVALQWNINAGVNHAIEEARRYLRDQNPIAYAFVAHVSGSGDLITFLMPEDSPTPGSESLMLTMFAQDGQARTVSYPIRRTQNGISFSQPTFTETDTTEWLPLGDIWNNPFCVDDLVKFKRNERPVDPSGTLWQAIVELTRLRIHDDQPQAEEYMSFLDDLRNGIFMVSGRPASNPSRVYLRPRTHFNPLGTLDVEASRLILSQRAPADLEQVSSS